MTNEHDDGLDLSAILALAGERKPLHFQYQGQTNEQPAYLELDEDGNVDASYSGEIGNGSPMHVWHGRTLRWPLPNNLSGDAIIELVNEHRSLLARVYAGHSVEWDGNNHVGRLDEDAQEAQQELDALLYETEGDIQIWPVVDWLFSSSTLRETWWDKPLADTVAELETHIDDNIELDGDIETALLDEAQELFDRSTRWGVEGKLNQIHVDALLADGRITAEQAAEWAEEQSA
jgi:hypothetical protein